MTAISQCIHPLYYYALTSARYGTKMAEARLPAIPDPRYMMQILTDPASFSRSRISQY